MKLKEKIFLFLLIALPVFSGGAEEKARSDQPKDPLHIVKCKVYLGDSRMISGTIRFRAPASLQLEHKKDGILYRKLVRIDEIEKVQIHRWKGTVIRESKEGKIYEFRPSDFTVFLKDEVDLRIQGDLFPFLLNFVLENENGTAGLFTFWRDFLDTDGKWHTGLKGSEYSRTEAHPDVVRMIQIQTGTSHP